MFLNNLYNTRNSIQIGLRFLDFRSSLFGRAFSMDLEGGNAWRGVPMSEIVGSQSPWGAPEFPLVTPSHSHAVLYHIPSSGDIGDRPLKPQIGQDKWDSDHVRMPCSSKSLYPVEDSNGETHLKRRWEMIEDALRRPILNSTQLADAILSYNTKFKTIWKFRALHALFDDHLDEEESQYFFTVTLPEIAKLALDLPKLIQAPIPLLKQEKNRSISLTQLQIASLLANAFFCTFPRRNTSKRNSEYASYPHINFSTLYECAGNDDVLEKLKCFCHYFRRVCTKAPRGVATFSRRHVPARGAPQWHASDGTLAHVPLHVDSSGTIEDALGLIQLDFANKYLGGGVLGYGSVQEEIRFCICPELMVSMLFTEVLRPNEALMMIGGERYSNYEGYSRSFRWAGDHRDRSPRDSAGRRRVAVLAIDAAPYPGDTSRQYRRDMITRELNKAWVGFSFYTDDHPGLQYPGIATGNWGCGAFGGSPQLKSLIQMMACACARRPMAYYTFGDTELRDEVVNVYNLLCRYNVTVGQLYKYLMRFSTTDVRRAHLHSFLQQVLMDEDRNKNQTQKPSDEMNISITPDKDLTTEKIHKELPNNSPDLFSQDEDLSQIAIDMETCEYTDDKQNESHSTKEHKMDDSTHKMADSKQQMAPYTSRLFDELQRLDDEAKPKTDSNTSTPVHTSRYFSNQKTNDSRTRLTENKMDDAEINMASTSHRKVTSLEVSRTETSRLFEEMNKFDEEHGKLNLSIHTSASHSINVTHDSDSDRSEISSEVKKKLAKKITDYFSKKT